jgi:hypothetical protein
MQMKSIGVLLRPVLFMSLASALYAKGGPKNDDPGEALPLLTGFILPNGMEQPFLHVIFENVRFTDIHE